MISVTYPNGVTLMYDETLKVGDIITTYHKGYHKLEEIEKRGNATPLFFYSLFAKEDGSIRTQPKKIMKSCDASYCRRASEVIDGEIQEAENRLASLQNLKQHLMSP